MFWKSRHEGHERAQLAIKTFVTELPVILPDTQLITSPGWNYIHRRKSENSSLIRRLVMEHLAVLGVVIDTEMNNRI
ncbi:hypothetical protein ACLK1T_16590 [Escherichia coli]